LEYISLDKSRRNVYDQISHSYETASGNSDLRPQDTSHIDYMYEDIDAAEYYN